MKRKVTKAEKAPSLRTIVKGILVDLGFKKVCSERQPGADKSWWKGVRNGRKIPWMLVRISAAARGKGLVVISDDEDFYSRALFLEVLAEGWRLSAPDEDDSDWCLSFYRGNKWGRLEARGLDTMDMALSE